MKALINNVPIMLWVMMSGIMAGFFYTYSVNVSRAFLELSGEDYATVQSLCNIHVRHPIFYVFFFGTPLMGLMTLIVNYSDFKKRYFVIVIATVLIYVLGVVIFTKNINLPLNAYTESWNIDSIPKDWTSVRKEWNIANHFRTGISAFCLASTIYITYLKWNN